jgi:hypothetical protein
MSMIVELEKFTTEKELRQTLFIPICYDNPYGSLRTNKVIEKTGNYQSIDKETSSFPYSI